MKTVLLMGRKRWAGLALEVLLKNNYKVIGVIGMPDLQSTDADKCALVLRAEANNIPVYNHLDVYDLIDTKRKTFDGKKLDIIISYLYPLRVKQELISTANIAAVNFHPGPLPEYQGVGGYNAAIMDERDYFGVTAHLMVDEIDAGEILKVEKFEITNMETAYSLEQKSMAVMFNLFKEVFSGTFDMHLKDCYRNNVTNGIYINKAEFEKMKFIEVGDSEETINKKIRAFWYPPYEGAKIKIGDSYYTVVNNDLLNGIASKYNSSNQYSD